ncbi:transcriptional regulator swi6 [Physocladia obscura]|uniref:Transcriptional regulator swi6 n=1 Tax=Physocladia obscura TaxID=109957 RepID=A0AAD5XIV0_9FUNG|nr:transcriptional regulator swi6 [Physocladia obscura]
MGDTETEFAVLAAQQLGGATAVEMRVRGQALLRRVGSAQPINAAQVLALGGVADRAARARLIDAKLAAGWRVDRVSQGPARLLGVWISADNALLLAREYGVENAIEKLLEFDVVGKKLGQTSVPIAFQDKQLKRKDPTDSAQVPANSAKRIANSSSSSPALLHSTTAKINFSAATTNSNSSSSISGSINNDDVNDDDSVDDNIDVDVEDDESSDLLHRSINAGSSVQIPPIPKKYTAAVPLPSNFSMSIKIPDPFTRPKQSKLEKSKSFLMNLFLNPEAEFESSFPVFSIPEDIDITVPLDSKGNTAFHWAASLGRVQTLRLLINAYESSAIPKNFSGETPLMCAVALENTCTTKSFDSVLKCLLKINENNFQDRSDSTINSEHILATISETNYAKQTVFHYTVAAVPEKINASTCEFYLESIKRVLKTADINFKNSKTVSLLDEKDWNSNTAVDIARRQIQGCEKILGLLKDLGATTAYLISKSVDIEDSKYMEVDSIEATSKPEPLESLPIQAVIKAKRLLIPATRSNPEFIKEAVEIQNNTLLMLEQLSETYNSALLLQTEKLESFDSKIDTLQSQIKFLRKENKDLRAQNIRISELTHRIALADRALESEKNTTLSTAPAVPTSNTTILIDKNITPADNVKSLQQEFERLQTQFKRGEKRIRALGEEKMALCVNGFSDVGAGGRNEYSKSVADMRKIIAFSCDVPMDQIDEFIEPILEALKASATSLTDGIFNGKKLK